MAIIDTAFLYLAHNALAAITNTGIGTKSHT
jgi:hypothetical protein